MVVDVMPTDRDNNCKIQIRKILVPIDGSECSLNAAMYAVKLTEHEDAQLFCIHVMVGVPYGYESSPYAIDQYFKDLQEKAQSWFKKVSNMARNENIADPKEIFMDAKSIV